MGRKPRRPSLVSPTTQRELETLKGRILLEKKGSKELVPLVEPNGEVDRVMRIWDVLDEAYEDVMENEGADFYGIKAQIGLAYAHPNEL